MSMETNGLPKLDNLILGEIQVLLAEKRTALAVMPLLAPLLLLNLGLIVLGSWLVFRSIHRIHHYERRIRELSDKYRSIAEFIE